jgi:anti-anti-sigma regulatory factor
MRNAPAAVVSSNVLVALVDARGAIDADGAAGLERELGGALDAGATRVIVDLSRAGTVTTAGMNALLAARQRVLPSDGEVAVVVPPRIEQQFRTLGLGRRFVLASDRTDAARRLGLLAGAKPVGPPAPRYAHAA